MSNKNEPPRCQLHPDKKCTSLFAKKREKVEETSTSLKVKAEECDDCVPWQRYLIYSIPLLLYIPWALKTIRCPPKCCPPQSCCPTSPPPPPKKCCPESNPVEHKCKETRKKKKSCESEEVEE